MALKKQTNVLGNRALTPYAAIDVTAGSATGDLLWEGPIVVGPHVQSLGAGQFFKAPGLVTVANFSTSANHLSLIPWMEAQTQLPRSGLCPGYKYTWKGFYRTPSTTRCSASWEPWGLGVVLNGGSGALIASIGSPTETTRDDDATIAIVIVNADNVSVNRYNNAATGDASYTDADSGAVARDVSTTTGFDWEMIVEVPSTATAFNNILVTITVRDSGGTMRTFFSAANPTGTNAFGSATDIVPYLLINQQGGACESLWMKVEKAA